MGIGGIGMSGIAAILKQQGYVVSGCDLVDGSAIIEKLRALGCVIHTGHEISHVENIDVLVYSSAVDMEHLEVQAALKAGIPVIPRAIMLAEMYKELEKEEFLFAR